MDYAQIYALFTKPVIEDAHKFIMFAFGLSWDGYQYRHNGVPMSPEALLEILSLPTATCQAAAQYMADQALHIEDQEYPISSALLPGLQYV